MVKKPKRKPSRRKSTQRDNRWIIPFLVFGFVLITFSSEDIFFSFRAPCGEIPSDGCVVESDIVLMAQTTVIGIGTGLLRFFPWLRPFIEFLADLSDLAVFLLMVILGALGAYLYNEQE